MLAGQLNAFSGEGSVRSPDRRGGVSEADPEEAELTAGVTTPAPSSPLLPQGCQLARQATQSPAETGPCLILFLLFYQLQPLVLGCCVAEHINIKLCDVFIILRTLSLVMFLALQSALSATKVVVTGLFWLFVVWCMLIPVLLLLKYRYI